MGKNFIIATLAGLLMLSALMNHAQLKVNTNLISMYSCQPVVRN